MSITEKLNESWQRQDTAEKVFEFRAEAARLKEAITEHLNKMQAIKAGAGFMANVDDEIKDAGQAVMNIGQDAETALAAPAVAKFIGWQQEV